MTAWLAFFAGLFAGTGMLGIAVLNNSGITINNRLRGSVSVAMTWADKETLVEIIQAIGLRRNNRSRAVAIGLYRLRLVLRILLLVLVEFFGHFIDEALVVFSVLQVAFCQDAVAGGSRIARQRHIFLVDLVGRAADTDIRTVAVKALNAGIDAPAAILAAVVMMVAAAVTVATVTTAAASTVAAHTSCVLIVSHADFFFTSFLINLCSRRCGNFYSISGLIVISCYKASVMSSEIGYCM